MDISLQHSKTPVPSKILLDSGAALSLLLDIEKEDEIKIPENAVPGNIGRGLGGDLIGYWGMVDHLKINEFELQSIPSNFQLIENEPQLFD